MKFLIAVWVTVCFVGAATAQTTLEYSNSVFTFKVSLDTVPSSEDGSSHDCLVKSIEISKKANKNVVQVILPPGNAVFCTWPADKLFILDDINFDGLDDFMIIQFVPASPNIPYYYWTFDKTAQQFQRDSTLEEITSPDFDKNKKIITSMWRASCCDHGLSTYKYINGKVTLIEETEIADDLDNPGQRITTVKKLINGEMKLVERKVEKVDEEGTDND